MKTVPAVVAPDYMELVLPTRGTGDIPYELPPVTFSSVPGFQMINRRLIKFTDTETGQ